MNNDNINKFIEIKDKLSNLNFIELSNCNKELLLINNKIIKEELLSDFDIEIQEIIKEINIEILPNIQN